MNSIPPKPPTLDTAPGDLAHAPEVPHHRFSVFHEAGNYAYARGLEVNPTHLPVALEAMRMSGWHLVSLFGETDSKHVGFIFKRERPSRHELELADRVDELLHANTALVERNRELSQRIADMQAVCADEWHQTPITDDTSRCPSCGMEV